VKDRYGNDLTTTSEAARDAYVAGVDHILAATWGARDAFEAAIEADSGFRTGPYRPWPGRHVRWRYGGGPCVGRPGG
jgi:hypothetical protein